MPDRGLIYASHASIADALRGLRITDCRTCACYLKRWNVGFLSHAFVIVRLPFRAALRGSDMSGPSGLARQSLTP